MSNPSDHRQEPLPQLRDAGEPLLETATVAKRLQMSEDGVRRLAENKRLFGFRRNAASKAGDEQNGRFVFPARCITLYEAKTANFTAEDVAALVLDLGKRLTPARRLWLVNELRRTLGE